MKKIILLIIVTLLGVELKSQSITDNSKLSSEISAGIGKVGFIGEKDFVVDRTSCADCDYKAIINEGYEFNLRLTINKTINCKNEIYSGISLNLWTYEVDKISGWTGESLGMEESKVTPLLDLIVGYRFVIKEYKMNSVFIENVVHSEFNANDNFQKFKLSVEPGIGFKIKLGDELQLLPVLSYKQSLTNFSNLDFNKQKPYSISIRFAINKTF